MHPDTYKRPLLLTLIVLILGLCLFYRPAPSKQDVVHAVSKEAVTLTGRVESFAVTKKDSRQVIIRVFTVNGEPAGGRVFARFKGEGPLWKDEIRFSGVLQIPYGITLPGQFNWKRYLANQHIFTEVKSDSFQTVRSAAIGWRAVRSLRNSILNTFESAFPPDTAAIAQGILMGERGEISPALRSAFQDSGAIHLLVASGGNVGFVTLLTLWLGGLVGLRRRPLLLLTLITAGLYTLVAGADAPLVRAYWMACGACAGYFLGRNSGVFQGLLLSCLLILLVNPAAVFDTGFQMSFLATLAIIICLTNYQPPKNWPGWGKFFARIFLATLASQLALLPIFANSFYKVSLSGLISNMLLVPLASLLMALSFGYYLAGLLHLQGVLYYPCQWGLDLFKGLVEFFASFRFSALAVTAWNPGATAAYYSLLFLGFHLPQRKFARRLALPCLLLSAATFLAGVFYSAGDRVYLLSEWDHRAVLVRTGFKTFIFTSGLSEEKLHHVLASLGVSAPTSVFSLVLEDELKPGVYYPFEQVWPGQEMKFGKVRVRACWEKHQTKEGRIWLDRGYSGRKKEGISYCVTTAQKELCIGQQGRFVQLDDNRILQGKMNETVTSRW